MDMNLARYDQRSPYANTDQTERYVGYLDFWNPATIPTSADDMMIKIEPKYVRRPDLLSYDLYGTPQLWWIFAMRNPDIIRDPIYDMRSGIVIYVPTKDRIGNYV
jgi:hypothetical protein